MGQSQGHRATKKVENSHSRNVKLQSTITSVLKQSCDVCTQHGVFGYVGSNGVIAIFVTWPEITRPN